MKKILSVENMRKSDAVTCAHVTPSRSLMFQAGEAIYRSVEWKPPVAIVCGAGNNAGDGYVLAQFFINAGTDCRIFLLKEKFSEDGLYYFNKCKELAVPVTLFSDATDFSGYATIVDCILGTGFHGELREPVRSAIQKINQSSATIVSVDINSGLNGDNGLCETAVRSDMTISIGDYQPGHFLGQAKDFIRQRINCPIGIDAVDPPYYLFEPADAAECLKPRKNFSNKGDYGYLALIGGSLRYSGAIRLATMANAAMRAGAGVVKVAAPRCICKEILPQILESTLFPLSDNGDSFCFVADEFDELLKGTKAAAFGMGIGGGPEARKAVAYLLRNYTGTLILDADGLNALSRLQEGIYSGVACRTLVLTPHLKEFSRLCRRTMEEINAQPIEIAQAYAKEKHIILLLKGPTSIITDGTTVLLSATGCPGMATAGSGDVLSGITAAICAANQEQPLKAVACAAFVNGLAGEIAQAENGDISMTAGDTVACIRKAVHQIRLSTEK